MKILEPRYAARASARTKLDAAAKAVERAKRLASTAAEQLKSLEQRAAQAEAADASQMAEMIAKGGLESAHSFANVDDATTQELSAARRDHSVKAKALATLEAARARHVDDLLNEAQRSGVSLKFLAIALQVNGAIVPASTLRVLNRLDLPLI